MKQKFLSLFLVLVLLISLLVPAASVVQAAVGEISLQTTLTDDMTIKGSKKIFDVTARLDGKKIGSSVTLNGSPVSASWSDTTKDSYTLVFEQEGENIVEVSAVSGNVKKTVVYHIQYEKAQKGDLIGYSTWTVEALTIGSGFVIQPMKVPIYEGENVAQTLDRILTEQGFAYRSTGNLESGFYFSGVANGGSEGFPHGSRTQEGKLDLPLDIMGKVPDALQKILDRDGVTYQKASCVDEQGNVYGLKEFDYTGMSGWMYMVNGGFPNVGMADSYLADGDVVRVQFTLYGFGADIGGGYTDDFYPLAQKDRLLILLASVQENKGEMLSDPEIQAAYDKAMNVAKQLDADQDTVDQVYTDLQILLDSYTSQPPQIKISCSVQPEDAVVLITDSQSNRVFPNEDGTYTLRQGDSYHYNVTKLGYVGVSRDFVAGEESEISVALVKAEENSAIHPDIPSSWPSFRGNAENNAVVDAPIPQTADDATLYWAAKMGQGFGGYAAGTPILVDDYLVFCSGKKLYKMNRFTGEIQEQTGDMVTNSNFNIVPPTYADGMIFVGLANGTIQAFNAETLESLWVYEDPLKGQPNSPLVYHDGYLYTGFWNSETRDANFVCVSVTDEDPANTQEAKYATWTYKQAGGFYWSGAYVSDHFVLVGTDDGASGYLSDTSNLLSLDPQTGKLIDKIGNLNGDIRSSISYDTVTDRYYFSSKGGSFYSVAVEENGTFSKNPAGVQGYDLKEILLSNGTNDPNTPPMSTSTPVVYNGRAYVGVAGTAQFVQYGGHNITVIDLASWQVAYTIPTKGYSQTSGLLSTAYEDEEDYAYVYFVDNYTPGQIRVIKDKPGVTSVVDGVTEQYMSKGQMVTVEGCAPVLFTPSGSQAQYAVCSPIVDEEGTIYFKNDSAYMMAVGSKINRIQVTQLPDKTTYTEGEVFAPSGMKVTAYLANGMERDITSYVTFSQDPLTVADTDITIYYNHVLYGDRFDGENGNETGVAVLPLETYIDLTVLSTEEHTSVSSVMDLIGQIGEVTLQSDNAIQAARQAYNALPEELQPYVTNYDTLTDAEEEYKALHKVASLIDGIGEATYAKAEAIYKARDAYDALTMEQQAKITNYELLTEAENTLAKLIEEINLVEEQIRGIGIVTLGQEAAIQAARLAYDKLPDDSKAGVENYDVLVESEKYLDGLKKAVEDVIVSIDAMGEVAYSKADTIQAVREAYDALTAEQQERVTNRQKLVEAEEILEKLIAEIDSVENKISAIGTVTLESEPAIQAAREAYGRLPEDSKAGVKNYDVLVAAEEALDALKNPTENPQQPSTGNDDQEPGTAGQGPSTGEQGGLVFIMLSMIVSGAAILSVWMDRRRAARNR